MCGITGVYSLSSELSPVPEATIGAMCDVLAHRGPDDSGYYLSSRFAFGFRRLSIVDLSGGNQPVANEDQSLILVCNGEIYNHLDLRMELEGKGHSFRTKSDVEVILHLYEEFGEDCVSHLNGMFAFALADLKQNLLFLGRDRVGIKPLYYAVHDDRVIFGSEIKAILAFPGMSRELDTTSIAAYLTLHYVPAPLSIFKEIRKLEPAQTLTAQNGHIRKRRYWALPNRVDSETGQLRGDWEEEVEHLLRRSIKRRLMSDVPLGAFLSGGVDSSLVLALMDDCHSEPIRAFSIDFSDAEEKYREVQYAAAVARR